MNAPKICHTEKLNQPAYFARLKILKKLEYSPTIKPLDSFKSTSDYRELRKKRSFISKGIDDHYSAAQQREKRMKTIKTRLKSTDRDQAKNICKNPKTYRCQNIMETLKKRFTGNFKSPDETSTKNNHYTIKPNSFVETK